MFKRKSRKNKERLSLLENEDDGKVVMQNWLPQSAAQNPSQQEQEELSKAPLSKDDQRILSMGVERPQRQDWTSFARNNPFAEETAPGGGLSGAGPVEGKIKGGKASIVKNSTKVAHKQSFSCDNPLVSQGNPFNMRTTTTSTISQPSNIQPGAGAQLFGKPGTQPRQLRRANSVYHNRTPASATRISRGNSFPLQQPTQSLNPFHEIEKFAQQESPFAGFGEPFVNSSSEENNKLEGFEKKKSKKKKSKKKKSKKIKTKKSKVESSSENETSSSDSEAKPSGEADKTEALAVMLRGTAMLKFPRRGRAAAHFKYIQITRSRSSLYLQWFSKRKPLNETTINIASMEKVLVGKDSDVYRRFDQEKFVNASFTIIYDRVLTLDLVAKGIDECKIWVGSLKKLIQLAKSGKCLAEIKNIWIKGINFVDKNCPKHKLKKELKRANMIRRKDGKVDPHLHQKNNFDVVKLQGRCKKLAKLATHADVIKSNEYGNLMEALSDLKCRLDELVVETRESCDSDMSKYDIWRFTVYLEALEEKTKVVKSNKNFLMV